MGIHLSQYGDQPTDWLFDKLIGVVSLHCEMFSFHIAQPGSGAHTAFCPVLCNLGSFPSIKIAEAWIYHCLLRSIEVVYASYCWSFTASYALLIWCLFRQLDSLTFVKWTKGRRSVLVKSKEGVSMTCRHAFLFYKMIFVLLCGILLVVIKFRNNICTWGVTLHSRIWK